MVLANSAKKLSVWLVIVGVGPPAFFLFGMGSPGFAWIGLD